MLESVERHMKVVEEVETVESVEMENLSEGDEIAVADQCVLLSA